jgi:hypothetical protein
MPINVYPVNRVNLSGMKFGKRTVVCFHGKKNGRYFWECRCECGQEDVITELRLTKGHADKCRDCAKALKRRYELVKPGNVYSEWTVIKEDDNPHYVMAKCSCGAFKRLLKNSLPSGNSKQCSSCRAKKSTIKHGHNRKGQTSSEYQTWCNIKSRVFNSNVESSKNYKERGIKLHLDWIHSFENFLKDVGKKPSSKHSLDRIDNNGHYEPGNVRWALPQEQVLNRRKTFKVNGEYIDVKSLSSQLRIKDRTIKRLLILANFTIEDIYEFSKLTSYQKIVMGKSINDKAPLSIEEVKKVKGSKRLASKRHPLWATWHSMKQRCSNPKNKDYSNYGGRGITVCKDLLNFLDFLLILTQIIGDKPSTHHQLDRIDPNGNYEASNLRWSTKEDQAINKRSSIDFFRN